MIKGERIYMRMLNNGDVKLLQHICNDGYSEQYNMAEETKNMYKRKALGIVNEKDVLIGFITYHEHDNEAGVYSLGITIAARYCNRGYGTDAVKTILEYLFNCESMKKMELEVIKENKRAIACYEKCGFKTVSSKIIKSYSSGKNVEIIKMDITKEEYLAIA